MRFIALSAFLFLSSALARTTVVLDRRAAQGVGSISHMHAERSSAWGRRAHAVAADRRRMTRKARSYDAAKNQTAGVTPPARDARPPTTDGRRPRKPLRKPDHRRPGGNAPETDSKAEAIKKTLHIGTPTGHGAKVSTAANESTVAHPPKADRVEANLEKRENENDEECDEAEDDSSDDDTAASVQLSASTPGSDGSSDDDTEDCDESEDDSSDDSGTKDSSQASSLAAVSGSDSSSDPNSGSSSNSGSGQSDSSSSSSATSPSASASTGSSGSSSSGSSGGSSGGSSSGSSGGSSGDYTGQATYFYQGGNAGACGNVNADSSSVIALDSRMYSGGSYCGKKVQITNTQNGKTTTATVADMCPGCSSQYSIDLSVGAFDALGSKDQGVLPIKWSFIS